MNIEKIGGLINDFNILPTESKLDFIKYIETISVFYKKEVPTVLVTETLTEHQKNLIAVNKILEDKDYERFKKYTDKMKEIVYKYKENEKPKTYILTHEELEFANKMKVILKKASEIDVKIQEERDEF